jgi:hypothetical protein
MSEVAIRVGIYNILYAIPDIGMVHDYERWAVDWSKFISFFKTTIGGIPQVRGWEIGRKSAAEEKIILGINNNANQITHNYRITGYMSIQDSAATEKTFTALLEAISAAFRADMTLNGACIYHQFIQHEMIDARMFGDVLCHYAEMFLAVVERI